MSLVGTDLPIGTPRGERSEVLARTCCSSVLNPHTLLYSRSGVRVRVRVQFVIIRGKERLCLTQFIVR